MGTPFPYRAVEEPDLVPAVLEHSESGPSVTSDLVTDRLAKNMKKITRVFSGPWISSGSPTTRPRVE